MLKIISPPFIEKSKFLGTSFFLTDLLPEIKDDEIFVAGDNYSYYNNSGRSEIGGHLRQMYGQLGEFSVYQHEDIIYITLRHTLALCLKIVKLNSPLWKLN